MVRLSNWSLAPFLLLVTLLSCASASWDPPPERPLTPPAPPDAYPIGPTEVDELTAQLDLIPRRILFGNPDRASPTLSPDGRWVAFLAPHDGVLNVWVAPREDPTRSTVVTQDRERGIHRYFWAHTNGHLVYLQDQAGDENWHAYSVDIATKATVDLTPFEGVRAEIRQVSHKFPNEVLVGLNDRDAKFHDIHRVDIFSGKRTLVQQNDAGVGRYVTDNDFRVRFAVKPTADGGDELLIKKGNRFEPWATVSSDDALTTDFVGFDESGNVVYMLDSRGRDTAALTSTALDRDGAPAVAIAVDAKADVASVMAHPSHNNIQAVSAVHLRKRWTFIDKDVQGDFERLSKLGRGDVEVVSRTLDDSRWIAALVSDSGPVRYYLYERRTKDAQLLFVNRKELDGLELAEMRPVMIKARDGLELVSYLTLPAEAELDDAGRPSEPLPTVLLVHGGPWSRDEWGFNATHQWLANRGYAVLSVNYRGSTGFGKAFINAADREWARNMHDDLLDAVTWAVKAGIARPDRVAIMGGSYGGYATLVGLTLTPDVFACGVDIVGPSNLVTLLESIPPYWAPYLALFAKRVGDHRTQHGRKLLTERSPLTYADRIVKPLLIGQGANDPRVKQAESDQIVQAMEAREIPVTYVLYPDEGHGFRRPENMMSFQAVAEAFLATCLEGEAQPFGDDLKGSSIGVPVGAKYIPGLRAAMAY